MNEKAYSAAGGFVQYPYGPRYPWSLYEVNVCNHRQQLLDARRQALRSRKWEHRSNREWNACRYLEAKRALGFLASQRIGPAQTKGGA